MAKEPNVFHSLGIMGTFCWIFKLGQREVLLPIAEDLEELLVYVESQDRFMSNSSIKKYIVKLSQRVGLCLLKPRVAAWRYQRGNRSLRTNLGQDASVAGIKDDKVSTKIAEETEDDENFEVPDAIEGVIERLMNGLRDRVSSGKEAIFLARRLANLYSCALIRTLSCVGQQPRAWAD